MQSLIIASKDRSLREEHALKLCQKEGISKFDITVISFEKDEQSSKNSIGIKEIREMQRTISLRPMQGDKKAVIVHDAHLLTTEAQNAMLKILEEPPPHTSILLTVPQKDVLLPTILSRCSVITLKHPQETTNTQTTTDIQKLVSSIDTLSIGERLRLAQDIAKNKDEAVVWIEKSIFAVREQLLAEIMEKDSVDKKYVELLKNLQWGYLVASTTNTNPRLLLENLFLSL